MREYELDYARYAGGVPKYEAMLLKWYRQAQNTRGISKFISKVFLKLCREKRNIELGADNNIGPGLYLGHSYGITISTGAIIGRNCNIHKGATIGRENRGKREGCPSIGNEVYIGINAVVVGKITIGDDVLIAANSFVNCDVPSHSIVIGNPCQIVSKENATEGYINNKI